MDRGPRPPAGGGGGFSVASRISEKKRMQEQVSSHRTGLPDRLLRLFAPRAPLPPYKGPPKRPPKLPYTGVAQYLEHFAEPGDPEYEPPAPETRPPEPRVFANPELPTQARVDLETKLEKDIRLRQERQQAAAAQREEAVQGWDPAKDPNAEGDPFKTLFVSRLSYDVTERKLKREFEEYGPIKRIRLVHDKNTGKPRGYAFIEYEHKDDMKQAYKMADGRKIEDKRCLVDVERGRTVPNWRPRRLGGGKGGERRLHPMPPKDIKKQFVARLLERAIAEKERAQRKDGSEKEEAPREERERRRERSRERDEGRPRERSRERSERERSERERSDRDRGERERSDRDRYRERERSSRDDRDRKRERSRERGYDRYDDSKRRRERDL
ncbi:U1 small nuclear ribonucleo isoform A [Chlorella sorokiniana]|uniref:U1 small nuclear ribonucleo isoform A n=1 Tax=Chlorella sorokiniana TaxID=3076 RepID=A0A2P6U563_CHLSO|nr:U1 small nuclear ribonucleo isoform A [Chlorella sorokiniana]|eukprot:PRW61455.1 U1 small nuclear ribonucleo isoform A [Chlorella sorokiniana]